MVFIVSHLRHSRISVVPRDADNDDTNRCIKQCVFAANRRLCVSAGETEFAIAMRRLMQAEAIVSQHWNDVKAIMAKPPKQQRVGELENAKEALEFAKAAHTSAKEALTEATLDKAQVTLARHDDGKSKVCFADSSSKLHASLYICMRISFSLSISLSILLCLSLSLSIFY